MPSHKHTPPTLLLFLVGYYYAEVIAVNTATPDTPVTSGADRAALGDPGDISVVSVTYTLQADTITIEFSEAAPKTAERWGVTVQTQPDLTEAPYVLDGWDAIDWPAEDILTLGNGNKQITIFTDKALEGVEPILLPGARAAGGHPCVAAGAAHWVAGRAGRRAAAAKSARARACSATKLLCRLVTKRASPFPSSNCPQAGTSSRCMQAMRRGRLGGARRARCRHKTP